MGWYRWKRIGMMPRVVVLLVMWMIGLVDAIRTGTAGRWSGVLVVVSMGLIGTSAAGRRCQRLAAIRAQVG